MGVQGCFGAAAVIIIAEAIGGDRIVTDAVLEAESTYLQPCAIAAVGIGVGALFGPHDKDSAEKEAKKELEILSLIP